MIKGFNNRIMFSLVVLMAAIVMVACGTNTSPTETKGQVVDSHVTSKATDAYVDHTEVTTEPSIALQGEYTIEESKSIEGVFIAYQDGSYDKYPAGGYCYGLTSGGRMFYGMFMRDYYAEMTNPIKSETQLVVFADGDYSLTLHPIHQEAAVFTTKAADGKTGYGRITQINDRAVPITIQYANNEREDIYPLYINGEKATEYEGEHYQWTVRSHKGISKDYTYGIYGFKRESTVTLGIGEGTSLIEKTYNIDATYYDCDPEHNYWDDEDIYYVEGIPTPQGYAEVDLTGVPNGRYVMVYDIGNTYWAMLLILDR